MDDTPGPRLGGHVVAVPVDGGEAIVEIVGQGPSIILLHGWTLDRRMWLPQIEALASHFTLIAVDRRGFGQSSAPPGRDAEVADLEAIVAALGLKHFALVAMSQSGSTTIRFANAHPDQVRALILQGISLAGVPDHPNGSDRIPVSEYAVLVRGGDLAEMKRRWQGHALMRTHAAQGAILAAEMLADYDGRDLLAVPAGPSATFDDVRSLKMPVLAITGELDTPWRRDIVARVARAAPMGHAETIADAGHLANICQPARFNDALRAFLGQGAVFGPLAANTP